jgi:N-acylglucosamine-6-phosphate 2-epimerase
MADCATYEDAKKAVKLGFDCIGSTLAGYTEESKERSLPD